MLPVARHLRPLAPSRPVPTVLVMLARVRASDCPGPTSTRPIASRLLVFICMFPCLVVAPVSHATEPTYSSLVCPCVALSVVIAQPLHVLESLYYWECLRVGDPGLRRNHVRETLREESAFFDGCVVPPRTRYHPSYAGARSQGSSLPSTDITQIDRVKIHGVKNRPFFVLTWPPPQPLESCDRY